MVAQANPTALNLLATSTAPTSLFTPPPVGSVPRCAHRLLSKKRCGGPLRREAVVTHELPPGDARHSVAPRLCHDLHASITPATSIGSPTLLYLQNPVSQIAAPQMPHEYVE